MKMSVKAIQNLHSAAVKDNTGSIKAKTVVKSGVGFLRSNSTIPHVAVYGKKGAR